MFPELNYVRFPYIEGVDFLSQNPNVGSRLNGHVRASIAVPGLARFLAIVVLLQIPGSP